MAKVGKSVKKRVHDEQEAIDRFHVLWYERRHRSTWRNTFWMGVPSQQCPFDLWVYQELIAELEPDTFIEVGVKSGGTTLFLAHVFDALYGGDASRGRVVGVDIKVRVPDLVAAHPRITLFEGDSTDPAVLKHVRVASGPRSIVLLDSDHTADHVRAELQLYSQLVAPGLYLIVNDTNVNGHPVVPTWGEGPWEAVSSFLELNSHFAPDPDREKHMLTQSPRGFLRHLT